MQNRLENIKYSYIVVTILDHEYHRDKYQPI